SVAIHLWISAVNAVYLSRLEHCVTAHFGSSQCGSGVGGEERIAGTCCKDYHSAFLHMAYGAPADIRLTNRHHWYGRLHPGRQVDSFQYGLKRQRVHHSRQHAHVVGGGALNPGRGPREPAEDVPATNDEANLRTDLHGFFEIAGNRFHGGDINAVGLAP